MEIPSNIAARIGEIEARFVVRAPTSVDTTPSSVQANDFASVLAASLVTSSTSSQTVGSETSTQSAIEALISDASASRLGALGTSRSMDSATGLGRPIASRDVVRGIEDQYRNDNGRLPDSALASIGGSHRLNETAANAFQQLQTSARAEGVEIGVTDSYRSYDSQVDVARRKGLYSQGGLAAKPGTSDHGLGLALDLDLDSKALSWMRSNAGRFGFVADTPRESWHWKFDGV